MLSTVRRNQNILSLSVKRDREISVVKVPARVPGGEDKFKTGSRVGWLMKISRGLVTSSVVSPT